MIVWMEIFERILHWVQAVPAKLDLEKSERIMNQGYVFNYRFLDFNLFGTKKRPVDLFSSYPVATGHYPSLITDPYRIEASSIPIHA